MADDTLFTKRDGLLLKLVVNSRPTYLPIFEN